eukprot:TRINITY_DN16490_c0_g1_i2.p1 TRINITY_DN16490_c0_g1~~TRINITY_DN16490_c0_g1_i2.p1  ORF type:complete len:1154 (+),score=319.84 TRINITY_DN16490_c0_g1_i2:390-3464(+)
MHAAEERAMRAEGDAARLRERDLASVVTSVQDQEAALASKLVTSVSQERARNAALESTVADLRVDGVRKLRELEFARSETADASAEAAAAREAKECAEAARKAAEQCLLSQHKDLAERQKQLRTAQRRFKHQKEKAASALRAAVIRSTRSLIFALFRRRRMWSRVRRRVSASLRRRAVLGLAQRAYGRLVRWRRSGFSVLPKPERDRHSALYDDGADPHLQACIDVLDDGARMQERKMSRTESALASVDGGSTRGSCAGHLRDDVSSLRYADESMHSRRHGEERRSSLRAPGRSRSVSPMRAGLKPELSPRQREQVQNLLLRDEMLEARLAQAEDTIRRGGSDLASLSAPEGGRSDVAIAIWDAAPPPHDAISLLLQQELGDAAVDQGFSSTLRRLRRVAADALSPASDLSRRTLGSLLRGEADPIRNIVAGSAEAAPLRVSDSQRHGLQAFLAARGLTGRASMERYLESPHWRWELWRTGTLRDFLASDGSHPAVQHWSGARATLFHEVPELCLASAAGGAAGVADSFRAARCDWRGTSAASAGPGLPAASLLLPDGCVDRDYFMLMVLELAQMVLADTAARRADISAMLSRTFPDGVGGAMLRTLVRTASHGAGIIVLLSPPSDWVRGAAAASLRAQWDGGVGVVASPGGGMVVLFDSGRFADVTPRGAGAGVFADRLLRVLLAERKRCGGAVELLVADIADAHRSQGVLDQADSYLREDPPRGTRVLAGRWGESAQDHRRRALEQCWQTARRSGCYLPQYPPPEPAPTVLDPPAPLPGADSQPPPVIAGVCPPSSAVPPQTHNCIPMSLSGVVAAPAAVAVAMHPQQAPLRSPSATPPAPGRVASLSPLFPRRPPSVTFSRPPAEEVSVRRPPADHYGRPAEEIDTESLRPLRPQSPGHELVTVDDWRVAPRHGDAVTPWGREEPAEVRWEQPPAKERPSQLSGQRGSGRFGTVEDVVPGDDAAPASAEAAALRALRFHVSRVVEEVARMPAVWEQQSGSRFVQPPEHIASLPDATPTTAC